MIYQKLNEMLISVIGIDSNTISPDSLLIDLVDDSLGLLDLQYETERYFDITIESEDIKMIKTVQDLVDLIIIKRNQND